MSPQSATAMQPLKGSIAVKQSSPITMFHRVEEVYDAIARRAFEIFEGNGRGPGHELDDWLRAESELLHPMHLELTDSASNLTVRAEVPGFSAKELEINVEPRRLTVSGKRETKEETKKGKTVYSELCANELLRVVELPAEVDTSKVNATLKDGVLNIEMAKATPAKTVRVEPKNS
jgi:HSP20 family protein